MKHIAVIMDGNGRWGMSHGGHRLIGHREGAGKVAEIVEAAAERGIEYLSLYAFSTENFKRSAEEVHGIFDIMSECILDKRLDDLIDKYSLKMRVAGDFSRIPQPLLSQLSGLMKKSEANSGMTVILCIAYGGEEEIANAFNLIFRQRLMAFNPEPVTVQEIKDHLYTANVPDPEVLVRYGGEYRLSNFLPLQCVYSELIFLDKLWPDFQKTDLDTVLTEFSARKRRFGREE